MLTRTEYFGLLLLLMTFATSGCTDNWTTSNVTSSGALPTRPSNMIPPEMVGFVVIRPVVVGYGGDRDKHRVVFDIEYAYSGRAHVFWLCTPSKKRVLDTFGSEIRGANGKPIPYPAGNNNSVSGEVTLDIRVPDRSLFVKHYPWHAGTIEYDIHSHNQPVVLGRYQVLEGHDQRLTDAKLTFEVLTKTPNLRNGQCFPVEARARNNNEAQETE